MKGNKKDWITYSTSGKLIKTDELGNPTFELNEGDFISIEQEYIDITDINLKIL